MTPHPLAIAADDTTEGRVIVIGAGVIGLSIAWRLAQAGRRVVVLERDAAGSGASGAAAGMLAPLAEVDFVEDALIDLKRESLRRYPAFVAQLEAASGLSLDYRTEGTLAVAIDRDDAERLRHHFDHQRRLDLPVQWLTGDQARALEPFLSPSIQAAVSIPSDHQIDNRRLAQALHLAAERAGAVVIEGAHVDHVQIDGGRVRSLNARAREAPDQPLTLRAEALVVAAGCGSRAIAGLGPLSPPVRPVKGQMLSVQMPAEHVLTRVVRAPECYLVPRSDGRLLIGATSEERGFDTAVTAGGLFELLRGAYETLPVVAELDLVQTWAGLRPCSLDNDPILGHTGVEGLLMATGHYRNGILLTPVTADAVAEALLTRTTPPLIAPFSPARVL